MAFLKRRRKKISLRSRTFDQLTRSMQKSITSIRADFQTVSGRGASASRAIVP
jgi:hypothetical protein